MREAQYSAWSKRRQARNDVFKADWRAFSTWRHETKKMDSEN